MREYAFELALCARLEAQEAPVPGRSDGRAVVARQLGGGVVRPGGRVLDVVLVTPGEAFDRRAAVTPDAIPVEAVESAVGPGRWRRPAEAIDAAPERARRIADRAVEVGFFEREYRNGRPYVRQVCRYPDWFDELVAVENKPDLGDPGALDRQLRTDVSLAVVDRVVVATASHVTGAHRNRLPDEVGIWRFRPPEGGAAPDRSTAPDVEVLREPRRLDTDGPGVELLDRRPGRDEVAVVDADGKARARRRIAERAYGKGWRPRELPACGRARDGGVAGARGLPYCAWKGHTVDPAAECGPDCPGHDPADPPGSDPDADRDRRTPWEADPDGLSRHQAQLDRFG